MCVFWESCVGGEGQKEKQIASSDAISTRVIKAFQAKMR